MSEATGVAGHDSLVESHGSPACAECGGLLAVAFKPGRAGQSGNFGQIGEKMLPRPSPDVETVQCASCGAVLWRAEKS